MINTEKLEKNSKLHISTQSICGNLMISNYIQFSTKRGILKDEITSLSCNYSMFICNGAAFEKRGFNCQNKKCNNKRKLNAESTLEHINVEYFKILRVIYSYVFDYDFYQSLNFVKSQNLHSSIRDLIIKFHDMGEKKIGGSILKFKWMKRPLQRSDY
ncbi:hypothetical protein TUBRATIS_13370 [Tubulinosema ratisbonensis]|uniref:Uncharacterized protein n=1 Tax=Tubulinosema ratisbonensis TaxID=291195 RepID=A0A437AMG3_9MICR|nr:hypothetical protein TUBRATIS_13370 [Tubulinosema ratisbonensis]